MMLLFLLFNMSLLLFLVQMFFVVWELVVSTFWVVWSQWDSSLFLDFHAINHGEINEVLLGYTLVCFIMTCCSGLHSPVIHSSQVLILHSSQVPILHSSQVHSISWMELPSWASSLLRCTLHTSSVQDLHILPGLLLLRQSYAYCHDSHLRAII